MKDEELVVWDLIICESDYWNLMIMGLRVWMEAFFSRDKRDLLDTLGS